MKMEKLKQQLFLGWHGARASGKPASLENPPAAGVRGTKGGGAGGGPCALSVCIEKVQGRAGASPHALGNPSGSDEEPTLPLGMNTVTDDGEVVAPWPPHGWGCSSQTVRGERGQAREAGRGLPLSTSLSPRTLCAPSYPRQGWCPMLSKISTPSNNPRGTPLSAPRWGLEATKSIRCVPVCDTDREGKAQHGT